MGDERKRASVHPARMIVVGVLLLLSIAGCGAAGQDDGGLEPSATGEATTLRTLMDSPAESPTLTVVEELPDADFFTSDVVSYESDGLTIHGVLRTPVGEGPFPGFVLVHGSTDPDTWSAERQYVEDQARLAESGYVTLTPDLRNHGDSDDDPDWAIDLEMGMTADVINAARALDAESDVSSVAIGGHSMGGALALNAMVVAPDVATAFVAFAPSSSSPWVNLERYAAGSPLFDEVVARRGTPEDNPQFWADVSSTTFASRATAPLLLIHGTADRIVPPVWSEETAATFREAGAEVELLIVDGADHNFQPDPEKPWARVLEFLASHR